LPQRKKERKTIFGAVNTRTGDLLTQVSDRGNTVSFFSFCVQCVRANAGKKVYLILDNVKYHHAKRLKPLLEKYSERIEFIFLPAYSPDLNPQERVWWLMRKNVTHNRWLKTMNDRINKFNEWSQNTKKEKIRSVCNLFENIY
jgi:putative transposase